MMAKRRVSQTALLAVSRLNCVVCRSRHHSDSAEGEMFLIAFAIKEMAKDMFQAETRFVRGTKTERFDVDARR